MRQRFNTMLSFFGWNLKDVSNITGFTPEYVRHSVSKNKFPRWAKLAVEVFERLTKK